MDTRFYHIEVRIFEFIKQCYKNEDPPDRIKVEPELSHSKIVKKHRKIWDEEFTEKYSKKKRKIETIYELVEVVKKRKLEMESGEFFFDIPNEIWILILSFVPFRDIIHNFSVTNKSCLEITYEDGLWHELNYIHFGQELLDLYSEEYDGDQFKLFILLKHERCINCKKHATQYEYFMPLDFLLCKNCRELPEFEVLTAAVAKSKYKLDDKDLEKLHYQKEWNPNNKQVPKITYLKSDVEDAYFEKRKRELIDELVILKVDVELVDFSEGSLADQFIKKTIKTKANTVAKAIKNSIRE